MVENSYTRMPGFQAVQRTSAVVLAGGKGSRLRELTSRVAKPAVAFGGKYRIIDFTLSNCINSGIRHIGVLTQYMANDLIGHLQAGWGQINPELMEGVFIIPAQQRTGELWYRGTADAVFQSLDLLEQDRTERLLVLGGDHIYKMDYSRMVNFHIEKQADLTVGCIQKPLRQASDFGVLSLNTEGKISEFIEKPDDPDPDPNFPDQALCSMGIYIFNMSSLKNELHDAANRADYSHDFGKDIIPWMIDRQNVFGYVFSEKGHPCKTAYWRDVGSLDEYHAASMDLVQPLPELDLYDDDWPIQTLQRQRPGAKTVFNDDHRRGLAIDSVLCGGVIVSGATVNKSLLSTDVRVEENSNIDNSVLLPGSSIGSNCRLKRVIVGEACHIPNGTVIGENLSTDRDRYTVSDGGVVLVTQSMLS